MLNLKNKLFNSIIKLAYVLIFIQLLVFLLRLCNIINFEIPIHKLASGSEEEAILSIWYKIVYGVVYFNNEEYPFILSLVLN